MQPVYVPKNPHEKAIQRALIQYRDPKNYDLVMEALRKEGRMDLVGFDKKCLIRPRKMASEQKYHSNKQTSARKSEKKTIRNVHKKKRR